jgi:hypothetical protein
VDNQVMRTALLISFAVNIGIGSFAWHEHHSLDQAQRAFRYAIEERDEAGKQADSALSHWKAEMNGSSVGPIRGAEPQRTSSRTSDTRP